MSKEISLWPLESLLACAYSTSNRRGLAYLLIPKRRDFANE